MILVEHPGCCGRKNTGPELGHPVKHQISHFSPLRPSTVRARPWARFLMGISKWSYCRSRPQQVLSILEVSTADGLQLVLPLVCLRPAPEPPEVPLFLRDGGGGDVMSSLKPPVVEIVLFWLHGLSGPRTGYQEGSQEQPAPWAFLLYLSRHSCPSRAGVPRQQACWEHLARHWVQRFGLPRLRAPTGSPCFADNRGEMLYLRETL